MSVPLIVSPVAVLACPRCNAPLIVAEPVAAADPAMLHDCDSPLLTPQQRLVLVAVASGRHTKGIASDLGISVKTVESHRAALMSRLDLHSVAELTRLVIASGWRIPPL